MSISQYTHRIAERLREGHNVREIQRAIANAPTEAARHEIEILTRR